MESCQVLCQVGRGGSRVASENGQFEQTFTQIFFWFCSTIPDLDLAPSVTLLGLLDVDLQLHRADWRRQLGRTSQPGGEDEEVFFNKSRWISTCTPPCCPSVGSSSSRLSSTCLPGPPCRRDRPSPASHQASQRGKQPNNWLLGQPSSSSPLYSLARPSQHGSPSGTSVF